MSHSMMTRRGRGLGEDNVENEVDGTIDDVDNGAEDEVDITINDGEDGAKDEVNGAGLSSL